MGVNKKESNEIKSKMFSALKEHDYKLTKPRKLVIETMLGLNLTGTHCTIEELYDLVHKKDPSIGLATVYRTVNMLYELRLVAKLDLLDARDRYEIIKNEHFHHHLVCDECSKIIEVQHDLLDELEEMITKKIGFKIKNHSLKVNGICKECQKRMEKNE